MWSDIDLKNTEIRKYHSRR